MSEELGISVKKSDFAKWYLEAVKKCGIIDQRYPVKGFPVYMPWGMFLTKQVIHALEKELENTGHKPVNFPVVIPEESLKKEKEHVKGFEKEVFWITHAGENKLDERLFLRPTSETAMYPMYALWIRSHMDLPLKLYQTVQVYRYETKMTKPLLRGREFFWIESHTAQKTMKKADEQVHEDMKITETVLSDYLGIPFLLLQRPEWDRFPGAEYTYAYDTLLPDSESLQVATTHNLGQKFSKPFNIEFSDEKGSKNFAYQTCFGPGVSRIVASIIAIHGDDKGLVLPPHIAPVQAVIIPVYMKGMEKEIEEKCRIVKNRLKLRAEFDNSYARPGFKFHDWEMKGVPIRIEIGPKDIEKNQVVLVRRDNNQKIIVEDRNIEKEVEKILDDIFTSLKNKARKEFDSRMRDAKTFSDLKKEIEKGGFVRVNFCSLSREGEKCAEKIEKELKAKVRGSMFNKDESPSGNCIVCNSPAKHVVYLAKAY